MTMSQNDKSLDLNHQNELLKKRIAELENQLAQSENLFRALTDSAPVGIYLDDADGKAIYINKKCAELVGAPAEEALNFNWISYLHPDDREAMVREWEKSYKNKKEFHMEYRWLHADGKIVWTLGEVIPIHDENGNIKTYIGALTDITARKKAEQDKAQLENQLIQAQKLESIGRLAGGVAHDFNNMLSAIICYAELALKKSDAHSPTNAMIGEILKVANRSADITKQLLSFARRQVIIPKVFAINDAVTDLLSMLRPLLGEHVTLTWEPQRDTLFIKMDRSQFDQIVVNLCINARDAIETSGNIVLTTSLQIVDANSPTAPLGIPLGRYVLLTVQDNGCGMNQETVKNIFEPFFTTKEHNKGTGLGLASVYGAVKQNNGFIDVSSELGQGTAITVYFPCQQGASPNEMSESSIPIQTGTGETILLVEDDSAILDVVQLILEEAGYHVLAANSPAEALRLAQSTHDKISLLITDIIMPNNNGRELANQLRQHIPHLKCLFMSGYTADIIAGHNIIEDGLHFIQKPFQAEDILGKINSILHNGESNT